MSARKPKPSSKAAPTLSYAPTNYAWEVPWNHSPIVLTAVFGFLWLLGTLLFASRYSATAFVLWHLLIDGGMAWLWLGAAIGYGLQLLRLTQLSEQHIDPPLRLVTAAALGLGAMGLAVLGMGLLGILARWSAIGLVAVGVLILILMVVAQVPTGLKMRPRLVTPWAWASLLVVPTAVIATMAALMPPGVMWGSAEPNGYDVVEYHLQVPREWYEAHRILPLHHNVFSFMPMNMEMHYLLAMHLSGGPWAGMYLCQIMHLCMVVLAVLSVYAIAQRVVNGPSIGVLAAVAVATVPWLAMVGSVAYDEGAFLLYSTLAIGWAMLALGRRVPRRTSIVLAGVMAGLACGVKLTAVPEVLGAGALGLLLIARRENDTSRMGWKLRLGGAGLYLAAGMVVLLPWLLRNAAWTRNPVFPEGMRLLGPGYFSPPQVERWINAYRPHVDVAGWAAGNEVEQASLYLLTKLIGQHAAHFFLAWATTVWGQIEGDWRFGFFLLPLGIAGAITGWGKPAARFGVVQLVALLAIWIGFTHLQGRFFLLAVPLCGLLLAHLPWERMASWQHATIASIIAVAAIGGAVMLERAWAVRVDVQGAYALIGMEDFDVLHGPKALGMSENAKLILVGDAEAFLYPEPMSRLEYHTVFDLNTSKGRSLAEAYGAAGAAKRGDYLWVDPEELERFEKTYQPLPPIPPQWLSRREPFLIAP
ncbi:MAG TPA: hypothetical protein VHY37_00895 [Tepidisphaeraceae bacterium]|nr:hypothetical protein [Tepidisphaeraceae bacterium]